MRVFLLILIIMISTLYAQKFELKHWENGETFGSYLNKYKIDATKFYAEVNPEDIKFFSTIMGGVPYFESVKDGKLKELLIPLGQEMQIHMYKSGDTYKYEIIPINYKTIKDKVVIDIKNGCYSDLKEKINNPHIATYLKKIFSDYVNFLKLQKGDRVAIEYEQKSIDGMPWGEPVIKAAYINHKNSEFFAIKEGDEYKIVTNSTDVKNIKRVKKDKYISFKQPLSHLRITSKFTYKRWHPILHRYRPHLGTDFGARRGTPIYAIASGKVVYAGWIRGYGKVTKISHGNGMLSLYAHQSKIYVKRGQRVKAGDRIGAVGSTGRSTGPHLHLGFYKNGKPYNPMKYLNKKIKVGTFIKKIVINSKNATSNLKENEKLVYNMLKNLSASNTHAYKWKTLDKIINIKITKESNNANRVKLSSIKGVARTATK